MLQLRQFWKSFKDKLSEEKPYIASLETIYLKLPKLKDNNINTKEISLKDLLEDQEDIKGKF